MADSPPAPPASFVKRSMKVALGGAFGLCTGVVAMYSNAIVNKVIKPAQPLANFAVSGTDGLTVTFDNRATGESGWWDFGDGSTLEPFDPNAPAVTHVYPKPGGYSVKLVVRNFLQEEADRSVPVDLSNPPNLLPPTVTGFNVQAIKESLPATYLITGQLANTDELVWKYGDKAEQVVAPAGGQIEKYVTLDKPGTQPIVLTALSKAKKDPQVHFQTVSVSAPAKPVYDATVTVVDAGSRTDRATRMAKLPVPVMDKNGPTKGFDRTVIALPNRTIVEARIDPKAIPTAKNVTATVAPDKKSVRVTGEWVNPGDKVSQKAGGSDVTVPLTLTEEVSAGLPPRQNQGSGAMDATGQILVRIPPAPANSTRTISVDFGLSGPTGRTKLATGTLDAAGNWSAPLDINGKKHTVKATTANGMVRVTVAEAGK